MAGVRSGTPSSKRLFSLPCHLLQVCPLKPIEHVQAQTCVSSVGAKSGIGRTSPPPHSPDHWSSQSGLQLYSSISYRSLLLALKIASFLIAHRVVSKHRKLPVITIKRLPAVKDLVRVTFEREDNAINAPALTITWVVARLTLFLNPASGIVVSMLAREACLDSKICKHLGNKSETRRGQSTRYTIKA